MNYIDQFQQNIKLSKEIISTYLSDNLYITNDIFFHTLKIKNLIKKKHYSDKLLSELYKQNYIVRIKNGYYTFREIFNNDLDKIINDIFLCSPKGDLLGIYSGQSLLSKYKIIEQIPNLVTIKSLHSSNNLIGFKYRIVRGKGNYFSYTLQYGLIIAEFFELILCFEMYDLNISLEELLNIYLKYNNMDIVKLYKCFHKIYFNLGWEYECSSMGEMYKILSEDEIYGQYNYYKQ